MFDPHFMDLTHIGETLKLPNLGLWRTLSSILTHHYVTGVKTTEVNIFGLNIYSFTKIPLGNIFK